MHHGRLRTNRLWLIPGFGGTHRATLLMRAYPSERCVPLDVGPLLFISGAKWSGCTGNSYMSGLADIQYRKASTKPGRHRIQWLDTGHASRALIGELEKLMRHLHVLAIANSIGTVIR